ncbi:MAG: dienelactone hydrolase family protein [Cyclobacteriaceae bacterium]|nr:dienelactone hydrolase family protein [Cyclobacteriaceae bacterium]
MNYILNLLILTILIATNGVHAQIKRLTSSPRHQEWIKIDKTNCFIVYPEISEKATVVLLIHENRGLNDWARSMADQLAEMGYIAIAPDLLSGKAPDGGSTSDFANSDDARNALYQLNPDTITEQLEKVIGYSKSIPAANGKVVSLGFCWGGSQSFRLATNTNELEFAMVCYGTAPASEEELKKITIPVYGFYGGNDNRVNATLPETEKIMKKHGKVFEYEIYPDAGHGFIRSGEDENPEARNKTAREKAIKRIITLLNTTY